LPGFFRKIRQSLREDQTWEGVIWPLIFSKNTGNIAGYFLKSSKTLLNFFLKVRQPYRAFFGKFDNVSKFFWNSQKSIQSFLKLSANDPASFPVKPARGMSSYAPCDYRANGTTQPAGIQSKISVPDNYPYLSGHTVKYIGLIKK